MSSNSSLVSDYAPIRMEDMVAPGAKKIASDIKKLRIRTLEQAMAVRAVLCEAGQTAFKQRKQLHKRTGNPQERKAFEEFRARITTAIEGVNDIIVTRFKCSPRDRFHRADPYLVAETKFMMSQDSFSWMYTEEERKRIFETWHNQVATAW